jgi:hypothetical protein
VVLDFVDLSLRVDLDLAFDSLFMVDVDIGVSVGFELRELLVLASGCCSDIVCVD